MADFDDLNGTTADDEDGVTFGTVQVGALQQTVTVNVQGGSGRLDAWIDFDGDGNWGGASERIFSSVDVSTGDNNLTFDVPSNAVGGQTFARFRLSTEGGLGVTGLASIGEVEDHVVTILSPGKSGYFEAAGIVSTDSDGLAAVQPVDLDGDGDLDILGALGFPGSENAITWYENDGNENFTDRVVYEGIEGLVSVAAADVDGDGDIDVIAESPESGKIAWYENDGSQNFSPRIISNESDFAVRVLAADVDGDGDLDVISAPGGDAIVWYENDGNESFNRHMISSNADRVRAIYAIDMDRDGDIDVLSASYDDDKIAWYENDGSQNFSEYVIDETADGANDVFVADLDSDGDLDVLSASKNDHRVSWYENDGAQNFTVHAISSTLFAPINTYAADMDGDGDLDVLSASIDGSRRFEVVSWFENDGQQNFKRIPIDNSLYDYDGVKVVPADVDSDGDLDVVGGSNKTDRIVWLENRNWEDGDSGDAPFPYLVAYQEGGARHTAIGPTLGTIRDSEADGVHSVDALGEGSDDDGVTFGEIQVGALDAILVVNVQGGSAKLDAWIDFNGDGNWARADEQIFASKDVVPGDNVLTFDVPAYSINGKTFARFRLSTSGGLGAGGLANDGEVEDYAVTIVSPVSASGVFADAVNTEGNFDGVYGLVTTDIDGDMDVFASSITLEGGKLVWYENDGSQNFTPQTLHSNDHNGFVVEEAVDLDGDGDMDVIGVLWNDSELIWFENDGAQNFTAHRIPVFYPEVLRVADLDADGDMDIIVGGDANNDLITWYENDGNQNFSYRFLSSAATQAIDMQVADMDRDGDLDVIVTPWLGRHILWFENDGKQGFTTHRIEGGPFYSYSIFVADMDGDGDMDLLAQSGNPSEVVWYENDGDQDFTPHFVAVDDIASSYHISAADIDGDGDMDILSVSGVEENSQWNAVWLENDGNQNFSAHKIAVGEDVSAIFRVADLDGDGDLDVLSASIWEDRLVWFAQNQVPVVASPAFATVNENTQLVHTLTATDGDAADQSIVFSISGSTGDNDKFEIFDGNQLRFKVSPDFDNPTDVNGDNVYEVTVMADDGIGTSSQTILVTVTDEFASVVQRNIFYNGSSWDDEDATYVDAIASNKSPLLNGQVATFANYTSYSKGINGIVISVNEFEQAPTLQTVADFFEFRVGNDSSPDGWAAAAAPIDLIYEENIDAAGTDQIVLIWADNAIEKTWLQVNVLANAMTGLDVEDTFYFGNFAGETGNDSSNAITNLVDAVGSNHAPRAELVARD